eukprot:3379589-Amphidinium_carterae.1
MAAPGLALAFWVHGSRGSCLTSSLEEAAAQKPPTSMVLNERAGDVLLRMGAEYKGPCQQRIAVFPGRPALLPCSSWLVQGAFGLSGGPSASQFVVPFVSDAARVFGALWQRLSVNQRV